MCLNVVETNLNLSNIRRLTITPSGVIYNIIEPEMSNRVLRQYKEYDDSFIRINFQDDNYNLALNMKYISKKLFRN